MNKVNAFINLSAIENNIKKIITKSGKKIIPIVKSNAYGIGALEIVNLLNTMNLNLIGVAFLHEALDIKEKFQHIDILLTTEPNEQELELIVENNIQTVIYSSNIIEKLDKISKKRNKNTRVHLFLDSGMNRDGVKIDKFESVVLRLSNMGNIEFCGLLTHFIESDNKDKTITNYQNNNFQRAIEIIKNKNIELKYIHSHNSGAIFNSVENHGNYVRPGISMYGLLPGLENEEKKLEKSFSLKSEIISIKKVEAGELIGYAKRFIAQNDMLIALVPIGYGHGLPFNLTNKGYFLVNGKKRKILGSVCMDLTMIEIDNNVDVGDEVVIIGSQGSEEINLKDLSELANTIPYEILTGISPRVNRIYI